MIRGREAGSLKFQFREAFSTIHATTSIAASIAWDNDPQVTGTLQFKDFTSFSGEISRMVLATSHPKSPIYAEPVFCHLNLSLQLANKK